MPNFYGNAGLGGGLTNAGSSYSPSSNFHSLNQTSNPTETAASGQASGARPYADVGKFAFNMFGPSPTPPTPQAQQIMSTSQHPLDTLGIGHVPILGDLLKGATNFIASAPDLLPWNLAAKAASEVSWALRPASDPEKLAMEQQIRTGWLDAGTGHAQLWRQWLKDSSPVAALADYLTPDNNMGEGLMKIMNLPGFGGKLVQRGLAGGSLGRQRLESLLVASDAQLENNTKLIETRDALKAGKISDNQAYDALSEAGFMLGNPAGANSQWAGPFSGIAGAVTSGVQMLGTDPLVWASLGTAGVVDLTAKAGATVMGAVTDRLGVDVAARLGESYLARTGQVLGPHMGGELLDEALLNPATSQAAQDAVNGLSRTTKFFVGAGPKISAAAETGLKVANLGNIDQKAIGLAYHSLAQPLIVQYGRYASKVLDKLTLFGRDDAAKATDELIGKVASEGVMTHYGLGTIMAARSLATSVVSKDAAVQLDEYIQRGIAQTTALVGLEGYTRKALSSQMFDFADNPINLAQQAARLHGSDLGAQVRDKIESVAYRVVPTEGQSLEQALVGARVRASQQLRQMLGISQEQADRMVAGQGEKFISLIDYAHFGYATKSFIGAGKVAGAAAEDISFMGPRQLSRTTLKQFRDAIKRGDAQTVRSMARQYDQLYFNLATDMSDEDVLHWAKQLADGLSNKIPTEITNLSKVPKAMADWAKAHPGYRLMYKPQDQWGAIIAKDGKVVGMNPYIDWVDEFNAPIKINAVQAKLHAALNPIASSTIQRRAMHRFSQRMGTDIGMDEATSQRVFWAIGKRAEQSHVTARGLERSDFYSAAMDVKMPKALKSKMTEAQVAEAAIWAHEGELGQVGITQKLTGRVKSLFAHRGNAIGYLAENIYPKVRFKWNPWFQTQELIETPILLGGRGVWPGTGGGTRLLNAQTEYVRGKLSQMGGYYKGDQLEYSDLAMAGAKAGENIFGKQTRLGRYLSTWTPGQVKRAGESAMFRHELGANMVNDLKREAPTQFAALAEWNATRGLYHTVDDGETAIHLLYDLFSRSDPEGALRAVDAQGIRGAGEVFAEHAPAAFRAAHIGAREPVATPLVRYLGIGKGWRDTSWKSYRAMLRDPANTDHTIENLAQTMRDAGASEDYIDRTVAQAAFPTPGDFYKSLVETSGKSKAEVAAWRAFDEQAARDEGIPLDEYLSREFADLPQTIDANGNYRGWSLFQRILQAHEARGFDVVGIDSPILGHMRDRGNEFLPTFAHRTDVPVNQLTSLEKKSRDWTRARASRETNPALGQPITLRDTEGNPVTFVNGRHQSGVVAPHEWTGMLEKVMTQDQIREATDWYTDMRRGFLAQYENDPQQAARAILGFALTQKNTSPANGMAHLYAALEKVRRGERLPMDQKFDGLATEELKRLFEEGTVTDSGIAQKLTDFIDSLLGNEKRTAGVHGPSGDWQPSAIDIWAKRDIGHFDRGIKPASWKQITGAESVRKLPNSDVELTFADGRVQTIPAANLGAEQPSHLQYDHGVEFYNSVKDHLNQQKYLNKEDWTAADVQALGWFRAKMAFGDDTGSPLDAFFRNHYNVNFDVLPAEGTRFADLYPGLANDGRVPITHAQAAAITSDVMDTSVHEAARVSGVQIIGKHGSTGTWTDAGGVANITPNVTVEVLGTDDGVRRFMAAVGHLNQQSRVRATKTVVTKALPSQSNGMRWAYDWPLPKGITKAEADEIHAELIAHDQFVASGSSLINYADGSYAVRSVWEPEAGVAHWQQKEFAAAVPEAERLSLTHTGPMYAYEDGYRRGRYVTQAEMDEAQAWGDRLKAHLDNAPTDTFVPLDDAQVTDIMSRVRETPWNGVTYNLRKTTEANIPSVGALPKGKPGKGPYITGAGVTESIPFQNVTEAKFKATLLKFVEDNKAELSKRGRYLGVFRDEGKGTFDFDVAYASWDGDEAEALQLALGREGGAYDTFSGNGVYAPVLRPDTVPVRPPTVIQPVRQRVHYHSIEAKNYAEEMAGAGRKGAGTGPSADWVRGDSERRTREAVERAYRTHAGYETTAFRAERAAAGDARYAANANDLVPAAGGEPAGGARLFQRGPRGVRAATRFDSAVPDIGRPGGRATLYFNPRSRRADTLVHEQSHRISNRLDDSAKRLYLDNYNRRLGLSSRPIPKPGNGAKRVQALNSWDENVHEAFANDLTEYLRTGQPVSAELKPLFDFYGKRLKSARDRPSLDPQTKALLTELIGTRSYKGGYHFNAGEKALMDLAHANSRSSEKVTNGLIYFKGERSWLERSINHQYLGLYPASYFWGKILPEMVEFLAFRPFGFKAPFVALDITNSIYQHVMTQQEYDPNMRKWMDDNEPYLRGISSITPGLPWDIPVNAPLWLRRTVEGMQQFAVDKAQGKIKPDKTGHMKDEWDALRASLPKAITDSVSYAIGPVQGSEQAAQFGLGTVGAISQAAGAGFNALVPKPTPEPGFGEQNPQAGYVPSFGQQVPGAVVPTTLEQAVQRGSETVLSGTSVEELQAQLEDQFASNGG